jgi:hypothetical protein
MIHDWLDIYSKIFKTWIQSIKRDSFCAMSFVGMTEDPFEELQEECYICLEPCRTKSPCKCERYVHQKCLAEWRVHSETDACTECLEVYPKERNWKWVTVLLYLCILYIFCGILGQISYEFATGQPIALSPPWSGPFLMCASCVMCLCIFVYGMIKRC